MSDVFRKLNLKDQREIVVLSAPDSFEPEMKALDKMTIRRSIDGAAPIAFSLAFVTKQSEVDQLAAAIAAKTSGDSVVWFASSGRSPPSGGRRPPRMRKPARRRVPRARSSVFL